MKYVPDEPQVVVSPPASTGHRRIAARVVFFAVVLAACSSRVFDESSGKDELRRWMLDQDPLAFRVSVDVRDEVESPNRVFVSLASNGCECRITANGVERTRSFSIARDKLLAVWDAVVRSKLDVMPTRYPISGVGNETKLGVRRLTVIVGGIEKSIVLYFMRVPEIESVLATLKDGIPNDAPCGVAREAL